MTKIVLNIIIALNSGLIVLNDYDPGQCNQTNHGAQVLVKDRKSIEKVFICSMNAGVYQWQSAAGDDPNGEIFSPGFDCSKILDSYPRAKDGMYWIHLGSYNGKKVYCDMTTDGGGYFLVGRMNSSVTWTVPSNDIPVEPYGLPHWASNLGDAEILDFRVQFGTAEDMREAKADWSFRLQAKRPLQKLMMEDKGCSQDQPGIGNIAYVKDLLTNKIVSTGYHCSIFGKYQHPVTGFGWHKMNSCLKKPCKSGFAYWDQPTFDRKVQVDFHGLFSFTASGNNSGVNHAATAMVGCSSNKICCGCYGPSGGRGDYCTPDCTPKNGGTAERNSYTWFWVRTSLPKRVWRRCMEYQVANKDGVMISYRILDGNPMPEKGRCSKDKVLLNEGVVVVPNAAMDKQAPGVPGLLKYRTDKNELSVRSNGTWEVIAPEKKILEETSEIVIQELKNNEQRLYEQNRMLNLRMQELEKRITSFINLHTDRHECTSYISLSSKDRNVKYMGAGLLCDRGIATGWYRFVGDAGTQMSTSCIQNRTHRKCSTHGVSWLNGPHPTFDEGKVTRTVCFSWVGVCCNRQRDIEVMNCGFFHIYKLVSTGPCSHRYCGTDV
ncbi:uncharacterized protein LOC114520857 isoform X2 [Dendronephthya gigantea]|uniref:uncharacterized protein LOC114520857 isoform X2 n=1 Tax=Dendronephthya gigantea TaxID=151771 RepID=UPI00106DB65D|nr:uncharacterized protein LOC114520857 isoform X2 [Dendronephthya gigantea]